MTGGGYYIEYGYYPQGIATDVEPSDLKDKYKTKDTYSIRDTDCPVYNLSSGQYIKYRTSTSDATEVVYKVEPVRWLILGKVTGDQTSGDQTTEVVTDADFTVVDNKYTYTGNVKNLLVLSEKVLIAQEFNTVSSNKWVGSSIQTFMNNTFINDIFTTNEQDKIKTTTLKTTYHDGTTLYANDTAMKSNDKLFLLGDTIDTTGQKVEVIYVETFSVQDYFTVTSGGTAQAKASDLGYATGCYRSTQESYVDNTVWWLRGGIYGYNSHQRAHTIEDDGRKYQDDSDGTWTGVRPACVIAVA